MMMMMILKPNGGTIFFVFVFQKVFQYHITQTHIQTERVLIENLCKSSSSPLSLFGFNKKKIDADSEKKTSTQNKCKNKTLSEIPFSFLMMMKTPKDSKKEKKNNNHCRLAS